MVEYILSLETKLNELNSSKGSHYWWQREEQTISTSLKQLKKYLSVITHSDPVLISLYLQETWMSELPIRDPLSMNNISDNDTVCLIENIIANDEKSFISFMINEMNFTYKKSYRKWHEAYNLNKTIQYLFNSNVITGVNSNVITGVNSNVITGVNSDLVKKLHYMITVNLLDSAGEYRTTLTGAYQTNVVYSKPCQIHSRLEALLKFVNLNLTEDLDGAMALSALFFSEFLLIHPFKDGNGRVARLLFSYLLRNHTIVPVSLYLKRSSELYMKVLEERSETVMCAPIIVFAYIVDCACKVASDNILLSMD